MEMVRNTAYKWPRFRNNHNGWMNSPWKELSFNQWGYFAFIFIIIITKIKDAKKTRSSWDCSVGQPTWDLGVEWGRHYRIGALCFLCLLLEQGHVFLVDKGSGARMGTQDFSAQDQTKHPNLFPGEGSISVCSAGYSGPWRHPACLPTLAFSGATGFFVVGGAGDLLRQGCPGAIRHGCPYIKNDYCDCELYFSVIKGRIDN